jgi:hypothetical protein
MGMVWAKVYAIGKPTETLAIGKVWGQVLDGVWGLVVWGKVHTLREPGRLGSHTPSQHAANPSPPPSQPRDDHECSQCYLKMIIFIKLTISIACVYEWVDGWCNVFYAPVRPTRSRKGSAMHWRIGTG